MQHGDGKSGLQPVVERYMLDVDRTLLRRNLSLTPEQRLLQLQELARFAEELRAAGRVAGQDEQR